MNRGLQHSKGEYVWFLNSGDKNAMSTEFTALISLISQKSPQWIIGMQEPRPKASHLGLYFSKFLLCSGLRPIPHQSVIFKKSLLINVGGYDTAYNVAADQKVFLQFYRNNYSDFKFYANISERELGGIGDLQPFGSFYKQINIILREIDFGRPFIYRFFSKICFCFQTLFQKMKRI
jgi:hypothetical protein